VSLALASRRAALLAPWHRNPLWALARAVPSLDLRFADDKSLRDAVSGQNLITFNRASSGTYTGSDGVLQTASNDEPRFDHDPTTGESLGLLVEEQRTNSIRNNTMVGAVAGTPGTLPTNWSNASINGITREIVGTGTEDGIAYIDFRFSGTNTLGSNYYQDITFDTGAIAAAQNQSWTESAYVRLLSGAISGASFSTGAALVLYGTPGFNDNASFSLAGASNARLATQRFSVTKTFTNAITTGASPRLSWTIATGATIDFTLRIGLPQLELGAFATSVISTTTAAATRAADVATDTTRGAALRSLYAQFRSPASGTRPIVSLDDNTANERIELFTSGTDPKLLVTDGGSAQADIDAGAIVANTTARLGTRFNTDNFAASISGGAEVLDATGTMPTVDRIRIGRDQAGNYLNGTIARITGWNDPLAVLPTLTQ
jgi:hypothetical protein